MWAWLHRLIASLAPNERSAANGAVQCMMFRVASNRSIRDESFRSNNNLKPVLFFQPRKATSAAKRAEVRGME